MHDINNCVSLCYVITFYNVPKDQVMQVINKEFKLQFKSVVKNV